MLLVAIAIVVMAAVITIAKEFIDKSKWSHRRKVAWSAFVAVIAAGGAILTVQRALSGERSARALAEAAAEVAHRRFTAAQRGRLKEALARESAPPTTIEIHSISGDPESVAFGIDLEDAIRDATWPAHHENMAFFGAPHGLQVRFEGIDAESHAAGMVDVPDQGEAKCHSCFALARALTKAGFPAKVVMVSRGRVDLPPAPGIELVVGYKPLVRP